MTEPTLALLLNAEQLASTLATKPTKLLILDVSSSASYAKHHLPGAIHIEPKALQCGTPPVPGKLPSVAQLTELFSKLGLRKDHHVIAYDDEGGGWAGRLIWTLDVIGHDRYSYLDGGIHAWVNQGYAVENTPNEGIPGDYPITINRSVIAEVDDITPNLDNADFAVWDARSAAEYDGSKVLAKRGGHIPGAINIDWLELIDQQHAMQLINLEDLQQRLNSLGLTREKTIVTHCQTHHRSGLSYLVMKILGYPNIKGYHGSWSEWGNREDTPIASGNTQ